MTTRNWQGVWLDPLDVLFFRGGRPFDASARVAGELPHPQTLAGALRTALLARHAPADLFRKLAGQGDIVAKLRAAGAPEWILTAHFRGPWLALLDRQTGLAEPLVPAPAILAVDPRDQKVYRDRPLPKDALPGWHSPEGLLPLWRKDGLTARRYEGYLTPLGLEAFLAGEVPDIVDLVAPGELFAHDDRTGIAISSETSTTPESEIYGIRLLALRPELRREGRRYRIGFYAEVGTLGDAPADLLDGPVPLGGEGRYVKATTQPAFVWPEAPAGTGGTSLWLMVSPGLFDGARPHRPDRLGDGTLRAAASGTPLAASGWNIHANGPNVTRFAVPAGAVYFVEGSTELPDGSLCADAERIAQGWGHALRGVG